jgi:hypothetical protein
MFGPPSLLAYLSRASADVNGRAYPDGLEILVLATRERLEHVVFARCQRAAIKAPFTEGKQTL